MRARGLTIFAISYFEFMASVRLEVKEQNPGIGLGAMQKIIAARWKELGEAERAVRASHTTLSRPCTCTELVPCVCVPVPRQPFVEKAKKASEEYRAEMDRVRCCPLCGCGCGCGCVRLTVQRPCAQRKRLGLRTEGDGSKRSRSSDPLESVFPLGTILRLTATPVPVA